MMLFGFLPPQKTIARKQKHSEKYTRHVSLYLRLPIFDPARTQCCGYLQGKNLGRDVNAHFDEASSI
jgi:hypothetical protein